MTPDPTRPQAIIIHGYGATPADHWFGWLAEQLEAAGVETQIPALPDPMNPDPVRWEHHVRAALGTPDEQTSVVAHSLGCLTVLRCLSRLPERWRLGTLVLVAGFVERLPALPNLDAYIADGCDVTGISEHVGRVVIIRSEDDAFVPPAHSDRLAALLDAPVRVIPGAGHFLAAEGVTALPAARDAITT
ncbi:RBBP9/YdeN family alpha/beta hydrolase [Quadrisphaera oryzae]|uniref:RBBP9/YdeN family alpha/beta hydrolase n=1 Tax=Quadrisphaera TaxID=317661 RepID=UPI00164960C7|nr:alpha/beta hydrolase [Quadrisphaera sp. RL12-1S]MBC3762199.1 alpha/beta hydrolase [Quadrisphaera sp. RL12-1S]